MGCMLSNVSMWLPVGHSTTCVSAGMTLPDAGWLTVCQTGGDHVRRKNERCGGPHHVHVPQHAYRRQLAQHLHMWQLIDGGTSMYRLYSATVPLQYLMPA